jgi:predicted acetyltransferase
MPLGFELLSNHSNLKVSSETNTKTNQIKKYRMKEMGSETNRNLYCSLTKSEGRNESVLLKRPNL